MTAFFENRRAAMRLAGCAFGLMAIFGAISFVPAILDEDRDAITQQWLGDKPKSIDPATNAYVAMLGLNAADSTTQGQVVEFHLLQRTIHASGDSNQQFWSGSLYKHARSVNLPTMQKPDVLDTLEECLTDCPAYVLREHYRVVRAAERTVLLQERYRAMLLKTDYQDDSPRDPRIVIPDYTLVSKLGVIYLADIMADMSAGKTDVAYERWANYQRFWQRVLEGSGSLEGHLLARKQLERGLQLITYLLETFPATESVAAKKIDSVRESRSLSVAEALVPAMIGEFQRRAYVLTDLIFHQPVFRMRAADEENRSAWLDRLYLVLYQPNASLNLMRREMDKGLHSMPRPVDQPSDKFPDCARTSALDAVLNLVGYRLVCTGGAVAPAGWISAAKMIDERTEALFSRLSVSRSEQSPQR